jgi:hypothetical protein
MLAIGEMGLSLPPMTIADDFEPGTCRKQENGRTILAKMTVQRPSDHCYHGGVASTKEVYS